MLLSPASACLSTPSSRPFSVWKAAVQKHCHPNASALLTCAWVSLMIIEFLELVVHLFYQDSLYVYLQLSVILPSGAQLCVILGPFC